MPWTPPPAVPGDGEWRWLVGEVEALHTQFAAFHPGPHSPPPHSPGGGGLLPDTETCANAGARAQARMMHAHTGQKESQNEREWVSV